MLKTVALAVHLAAPAAPPLPAPAALPPAAGPSIVRAAELYRRAFPKADHAAILPQIAALDAAVAAKDFSAERRAGITDAGLRRVFDGTAKAAAAGKEPWRHYFGLMSGRLADVRLRRRRISSRYEKPAGDAVKVAFFDADSTLRVSLSGSVSANGPKDVMLLPWIERKLKALAEGGYLIAIVSNQGGVPRSVSMGDADRALAYAVRLIRAAGGEAHYHDFAESTGRKIDRKPGTGMAQRLERALKDRFGEGAHIDKTRSFMVGDSAWKKGVDVKPDGGEGTHFSNADRLFAENLGVPFFEPADFFGWRPFGIDVFTTARQAARFLKEHPAPPEG